MAYPVEFKEKAVELANSLNSINRASIILGIAYNVLKSWKEKHDKGEDLKHRSGGKRFEKIDKEKLKDYIDKNPDKFLEEIAEEFGCSKTAIDKALKNMGYTNKKNYKL